MGVGRMNVEPVSVGKLEQNSDRKIKDDVLISTTATKNLKITIRVSCDEMKMIDNTSQNR